MAQIKKLIDQEIKLYCAALGFKKKKYWYVKPITDDAWALLSFPCATYPGVRRVAVHVGITFSSVERLYFIIENKPLIKGVTSIIAYNIGYLEPDYRYKSWDFFEDITGEGISEEVDSMFEDIEKYAYPFYQTMSTRKAVIDQYEQGIFKDRQRRLHLPPILYLLEGEKEKGVNAIQQVLDDGYQLCDWEKQFIDNYMNYVID